MYWDTIVFQLWNAMAQPQYEIAQTMAKLFEDEDVLPLINEDKVI